MQQAFSLVIAALWLCFIVVWLIAAASAGASVRGRAWWRSIALRAGIIIVLVVLTRIPSLKSFLTYSAWYNATAWYPILGGIGVLVAALGLTLAIYARVALGRNWGMPMTLRRDPQLVTGGPYAYVRHPIYTAVSMMMLGSVLTIGPIWIIVFVFFFAYFFYSAKTEEKDMAAQFPEEYPAYKTRTKMLIPFVF